MKHVVRSRPNNDKTMVLWREEHGLPPFITSEKRHKVKAFCRIPLVELAYTPWTIGFHAVPFLSIVYKEKNIPQEASTIMPYHTS